MKILITGGLGYIGSHAAVVLSEARHDVVILDNLSNSNIDVLKRLKKIVGKDLPFICADINDTNTVLSILKDFSIDAVMHFAGLKSVAESVKNPIKYYYNNVVGSISLFDAMTRANVKKIVFSSSATVYGEPKFLPYDEDHPTNPINPYGQTKLQVEKILNDLVLSDASWTVALLRYFNPAGSHDSGLIGEHPNGIPSNLMPYIAQVAFGQLPKLKVYGNDYPTRDGTGERDYIHVVDLVEGHLSALNFLNKNSGCHAFNLGTGLSVSVLELVKVFELTSKKTIPLEIVGRRHGDLPVYFAKVSRANDLLKWKAHRSIEDICSSVCAFQKKAINN
jgi:UDP-glucose 4-epimerase